VPLFCYTITVLNNHHTMSRFASKEVKKIELGNDEYVEIYVSLPFSKMEPIMAQIDEKNPNANLKLSLPVVQAGIASWNLKNESGEDVPCTPENIAELNFTTISTVAKECFELYFLGLAKGTVSKE
jgi:hypothetical protein